MPANTTIIQAEPMSAESPVSAVSWTAIVAGAFASLAVMIILLAFEGWLGFASILHATGSGAPKAITFLAAAWLIIVQWLSSGVGGYIAGRLRTRWVGLHTHEVFFRDTVHGFLSWAVATIICLALAVGAFASLSEHAFRHHNMASYGEAGARGSVVEAGDGSGPLAYYIDNLYRSSQAPTPLTENQYRPGMQGVPSVLDIETRRVSSHILMKGLGRGDVPEADRAYLAQLVASHTGLTGGDAEKRVDDVIGKIKADEQTAEKATAALAFYTFLAMLIGAFIATAAGALGGHLRDEYTEII